MLNSSASIHRAPIRPLPRLIDSVLGVKGVNDSLIGMSRPESAVECQQQQVSPFEHVVWMLFNLVQLLADMVKHSVKARPRAKGPHGPGPLVVQLLSGDGCYCHSSSSFPQIGSARTGSRCFQMICS